MAIWQAILMGLVQGCTEFLPISSSGHLVLLDQFLHVSGHALAFDTMLHLGTLLAVIAVYRKDLAELLRHPLSRTGRLLIAATIPTVIIGLIFEKTFEAIFHSGATIGEEFVFTGALILYTELQASRQREGKRALPAEALTYRGALWIGLAQGAAIMPALSRSGLTLCAALGQGIDRKEAVRFSFLLSIPVILGGALVQGKEWLETGGGFPPTLWIGLVASAVSGYVAIHFFTRFIARRRLNIFGYYTLILGTIIIIDQFVTHRFF
ncbi:MAG: undecaprenyl-diphosphate phosphatase [Firmicutes bacterium]|nr:undecaprenyl-diphosphate phosphatase [Bacillota bacterium]